MKHTQLLLLLSFLCSAPVAARTAPGTPPSQQIKLRFREKIVLKIAEKRLRKLAATLSDSTRPCGYLVIYPGERVEAELLEMSSSTVTYRPCGDPAASPIVRPKSQIVAVVAANGDELYSHLTGPFSRSDAEGNSGGIQRVQKQGPQLDAFAIMSVVFGLAPFTLTAPILAILTAAIGLARILNNPHKYKGRAFALIGLILGLLGLLLLIAL